MAAVFPGAGALIGTVAALRSEKHLARRLDAMDICALSFDTEQMPFPVLEAMTTGLPVASTDVGEVDETPAPDGWARVMPAEHAALAGTLARSHGDAAMIDRLVRA